MDSQAVCTIDSISSLVILGVCILPHPDQPFSLRKRPFILGLDHQLSQRRVQMRIIDLREWGATSAMENEHMTFSSDQFSHLLGKVSAEPIQQNNDAF